MEQAAIAIQSTLGVTEKISISSAKRYAVTRHQLPPPVPRGWYRAAGVPRGHQKGQHCKWRESLDRSRSFMGAGTHRPTARTRTEMWPGEGIAGQTITMPPARAKPRATPWHTGTIYSPPRADQRRRTRPAPAAAEHSDREPHRGF
jgi:hypothetical protein